MYATRILMSLLAISIGPSVPAAEFEKLSMPDGLAFTVDPLTGVGSVRFSLVNKSGRPSKLDLRSEGLAGVASHLPPHWVKLDLKVSASPRADISTQSLNPNESMDFAATVSDLVEPGDYSFTVFNGPIPLGKIQVSGFPFRVHPDASSGSAVPIPLGPDTGRFAIRNDDPFTYQIEWELSYGSKTMQGRASLRPSSVTEVEIRCNSAPHAGCSNKAEDAWEWFSLWLRDESRDGRLRLTYIKAPGTNSAGSGVTPSILFPARVSIRAHPEEQMTVAGSVVLILVLAFGAFASLCANSWVPHNLRKNALQTRLLLCIRRVRELSASMPSRVRIAAEVDCLQIKNRLKDEGSFYSDFDAILQDYESHVTALEARVGLLSRVDEYQRVLEQVTTMPVPPALITRAREPFDKLSKLFEGGEWSDGQIAAATILVDTLQNRVQYLSDVRASGQIDADLKSALQNEFIRLKSAFGTPRGKTAARFEQAVPGPFRTLEILADPNEFSLIDWVRLDISLWKLRIIERFINSFDGASSQTWKERLEVKAGFAEPVPTGSLIYYLELNTWDALSCAEQFCAEVEEGIFPEDICRAITSGNVCVQVLQKQIMSERRVDLNVCFSNYSYNQAAARVEITPEWTFTPRVARKPSRLWGRVPDPGEPRSETGWGVSCLARAYRFVDVTVCFRDWYGILKIGDGSSGLNRRYPIESSRTGLVLSRFGMELSKLALGLALPIVGLLGGAREKLLTMDVSTALAAVFILGFGADSVKNSLVRGTVSAPAPTAPKALSAISTTLQNSGAGKLITTQAVQSTAV